MGAVPRNLPTNGTAAHAFEMRGHDQVHHETSCSGVLRVAAVSVITATLPGPTWASPAAGHVQNFETTSVLLRGATSQIFCS